MYKPTYFKRQQEPKIMNTATGTVVQLTEYFNPFYLT